MTAIQDWMRDYLVDAGNEKLGFVGSCKNEKNIEKIAVSIRDTIGLNINWFSQSKNAENSFDILRKYFEEAGILIIKNGIVGQNTHRPLDVNEFRAFTLIDDYAPLVFINNKDIGGKLFSLLHEITHIWIGLHSFYNDSYGTYFNVSPLETLCNAVAGELLVPNVFFIKEWKKNNNLSLDDTIEKTAQYFKCGKMVIARKAHNNQYITNNQYQKIANEIIANIRKNNQNNRAKESGGDFYNTAISRYGTRFILALTNSINEGKTLHKEAYKLTNTSRDTFDKLVNEVRERIDDQ
jgi:Zn-dependent peptidase ImmA (M78 family)